MSYIVMALRGRLGNNLWQFAAGLGIARALGARLCFDSRRVTEGPRLLPELIGAHYADATPAELRRVGVIAYRPGAGAALERFALRNAYDLGRRALRKGPSRRIRYEGDDEFGDWPLTLDLPAYVGGYFHDERYFAAVADEVADAIRWPAGIASLPEGCDATVAVTFRRADYNLFEAGVPIGYYDRAMQLVVDSVDRPTFVLFGDDPAFIDLFAERADRRGYTVISALQLGHDAITQLKLISECDHAILANSSFAWWGAWLGDRRDERDRTVIVPAGWSSWIREPWLRLEEVPGVVTTYDLSTHKPNAALS